LAASHHLLLAHGKALSVLRQNVPGAHVGITLNMGPQVPASSSLADRAAATWKDGFVNRWFLDPLVGRGYPQDMVDGFGDAMDFIQPGDMKGIAVPVDFVGVNYYTRHIFRSEALSEEENEPVTVFPNEEHTEMGWEVYPEGLYLTLGRLHFDYAFPEIFITENGAAFVDEVGSGGEVDDPQRLSYIRRHLQQVHRAIAADMPVKGYFAWSLLDNFEWAFGFSKRFGLIYVDYESQQRIPKSSAKWYANVIKENAVE
jgi:beta-glucosidase